MTAQCMMVDRLTYYLSQVSERANLKQYIRNTTRRRHVNKFYFFIGDKLMWYRNKKISKKQKFDWVWHYLVFPTANCWLPSLK